MRRACYELHDSTMNMPQLQGLGGMPPRPSQPEGDCVHLGVHPNARSELFEKRRTLMESWARYLEREAGDVIKMPRMA